MEPRKDDEMQHEEGEGEGEANFEDYMYYYQGSNCL